jgi:hypothetical protein
MTARSLFVRSRSLVSRGRSGNRIQEQHMAESSNASSNNGLYFLVGGLVVVVGVIAFMYFGGLTGGHTSKLEISVEAPKT